MSQKREKESKIRKKINQIYEENELANLEVNKNRARSFTVGTAFGGVIEVSMRGDYSNLWCLLQPVEAVEFIEQLAAAAGLQVALRPKQDFSTWRGWEVDSTDKYWVGAARWQLNLEDNIDQIIGTNEAAKMLQASKESETLNNDATENKQKKTRRKRKSTKNTEEIKETCND